jgi:hypothetical protein
MVVCPTVEESWIIGFENGDDTTHWLALEMMYALEWIQCIVLPPPTAQNLTLVDQPTLGFNTRQSTELQLKTEPHGLRELHTITVQQTCPYSREPRCRRERMLAQKDQGWSYPAISTKFRKLRGSRSIYCLPCPNGGRSLGTVRQYTQTYVWMQLHFSK